METISFTLFLTLVKFGAFGSGSTATAQPEGDLHALLVAGSNGWWNYRHQADVAHAYQLLIGNGIPAENIIVMMYDDIATNRQNPYPGKLFNRPHGNDVYNSLKIDYNGSSVNSSNFLNVLQGNVDEIKGGNGRVINSKQNDRIFVYFTDHGGEGVICFQDDLLTKKDLNDALRNMHRKQTYGQFVFYLEACESGSMFDGTLSDDMNIYAMTAANPHESSWGTYCDNDMNLPCLGDLFSVSWMQDSEKHNIDVETLQSQFINVRKLTDESHVMSYGSLNLTNEPVGWFEGEQKRKATSIPFRTTNPYETEYPKISWPARDIELMHLRNNLKKISSNSLRSLALKRRIAEIHKNRRNIEALFTNLIDNLLPNIDDRKEMFMKRNIVKDLICHHNVVKAFDSICIDVNKFDYALKYIYVLNNLCVKVDDSKTIINSMHTICSSTNKLYL
ncbi:peptidase C13 family protein [Dictyocaulus viviparus]|uniref:legumain n=1 Tax=Dictyocaulus viviparus TaxID=29172 RepID=A0A0D8XXV3_DICVI|nr:peptidase C13 family protein [Dictyocaulus viviparus]